MPTIEIPEPPISKLFFSDTRSSWVWLLIRLYVGWVWVEAGWAKLQSPAWVGSQAGTALRGFAAGALAKTAGDHPDVQGWYATFLQQVIVPNAPFFSLVITLGELAVGVGLVLGILTGIAAFFGSFMNMNFLLSGAVSVNPVLLFLQLLLILAWRVAGWYGGDHYLLPLFGTPWQPEVRIVKSSLPESIDKNSS